MCIYIRLNKFSLEVFALTHLAEGGVNIASNRGSFHLQPLSEGLFGFHPEAKELVPGYLQFTDLILENFIIRFTDCDSCLP